MRFPFIKLLILVVLLIFLLSYFLFAKDYIESGNAGRIISTILSHIWLLTIITIIFVLILENRSPSKTLSWILILFFLPVLGFIIYLIFGRNFRKKKIFARKEYNDYEELRKINQVKLDQPYNRDLSETENPAVRLISRLLENNNKAFLTYHNDIEFYRDGEEAIAAIYRHLDKAEKSIHLQFFIIKSDETGKELKELLLKKAAQGLEVRVLYDAVGSYNIGGRYVRDLQRGGVDVACFLPVEFPFISSKMNYRNHRKITIIDGHTGFLGGVNIANRYVHKDKYYGYWRDTHLKIEGEAVHSLQALFLNDWCFATGQNLFDDRYFTARPNDRITPVQIISSGPDSDWESIMQGYFAMIALASRNINIVTPYLVLNESMLTAVKVSALSGVDVKLIVPNKPDHHLVYWASRSYFQELMEAGVRIYEYEKGFIHSKYITVDGLITSIGTANMDIRSFTHNMELNAFLFNREVTTRLDEIFAEDLSQSREIVLEEYLQRNFIIRMKESFNRLFSPLL